MSADPKLEPLDREALAAFLESSFKNGKLHYRPLTIGVEQEFFIEQAGLPVGPEQSLQFFEALRTLGWTQHTAAARQDALQLHAPYSPGSVLKYEHYPHLLEVAFDYFANLHELASILVRVFADLNQAGIASKIEVGHRPFCSVPGDHPLTLAKSERAQPLLAYRERLLEEQGRTVAPELLNFSAVIAATQIHVGGLDWWSDTAIVERLYSFEPDILPLAYHHCEHRNIAVNPVWQRWRGYKAVLGEFPLVGFPDLSEWSRDSWLDALGRSPCLEHPITEPRAFLKQVRDLQIVRPRVFGTLEFRADPAQDSPRSILALAALRLAVTLAAMNGLHISGSMTEHRDRWWRVADHASPGATHGLGASLLEAGSWLEARRLGEERYLAPLLDAQTQNV